MPYQQVKYQLYSQELGLLELEHDPIGWEDDQKTLERSAISESFFTRYSNDIRFIREGADYIRIYVNTFGSASSTGIFCRRFELNYFTDEFDKVYDENLDLETYSITEGVVSIGFLSGGLNNLIKAQFDKKFQLQRVLSVQEKDIPPLEYETLAMTNRKILLQSYLENNEAFTHIAQVNPGIGLRTTEFTQDHDIQYQSDELVRFVVGDFNRDVQTAGNWRFTEGQQFYGPSDRDKTLKIRFKGNPTINYVMAGTKFWRHFLVYAREDTPGNYLGFFADDIIIAEDTNATSGVHPYDVTLTVPVKEGQVLAFITTLSASTNQDTTYSEEAKGVSIFIEEDSVFPTTGAKGLLYKDALERVLQIITGKDNILKSDFFTTEPWINLFITPGIFLRGFPETELDSDGNPIIDDDGNVKTNGITTSLKELLSIKAHLNIGWGVERIGNQEFFRVEPLTYFFQNRITIRLNRKFCPVESLADEFNFGSVRIGNSKSGKYEEQQGLYEYNARNLYTTSNVNSPDTYELATTLRTDAIGAEHTRRKSFSSSPTLDVTEDVENWLFHVDPFAFDGLYRLRVWQDDLDQAPTQVYDPDTAYNLLLTPIRSLERHGWYLNSSLYTNPNESVLFASSEGNANMISKLPGEVERGENKPYRNGDLKRPRFINRYVDFDFPNTLDIKTQINGFFEDANGNPVPNYYGMVEYTNEEGQLTYGWILKVNENDSGSMRLIKSNR